MVRMANEVSKSGQPEQGKSGQSKERVKWSPKYEWYVVQRVSEECIACILKIHSGWEESEAALEMERSFPPGFGFYTVMTKEQCEQLRLI